MSEEEIKKEMVSGYFFFGVRIDGKLVGVYKASITERGLFRRAASSPAGVSRPGCSFSDV